VIPCEFSYGVKIYNECNVFIGKRLKKSKINKEEYRFNSNLLSPSKNVDNKLNAHDTFLESLSSSSLKVVPYTSGKI
jgi:hypothetical protein